MSEWRCGDFPAYIDNRCSEKLEAWVEERDTLTAAIAARRKAEEMPE